MSTEEAIDGVVRTIRDQYAPEKIILFGSRIWGEPDEDSDLDILVIKETEKRPVERVREVLRIVEEYHGPPYYLPMDILVRTPQEIEDRLAIGDDFIRQIITEGEVAYERAMA